MTITTGSGPIRRSRTARPRRSTTTTSPLPPITTKVKTSTKDFPYDQIRLGAQVTGTELALARDPSIKCTTLDDVNQVEFRGQQTSLSDAATQAYPSLGLASGAVSGPWAWTCEGKKLDDMRRELDEMRS